MCVCARGQVNRLAYSRPLYTARATRKRKKKRKKATAAAAGPNETPPPPNPVIPPFIRTDARVNTNTHTHTHTPGTMSTICATPFPGCPGPKGDRAYYRKRVNYTTARRVASHRRTQEQHRRRRRRAPTPRLRVPARRTSGFYIRTRVCARAHRPYVSRI